MLFWSLLLHVHRWLKQWFSVCLVFAATVATYFIVTEQTILECSRNASMTALEKSRAAASWRHFCQHVQDCNTQHVSWTWRIGCQSCYLFSLPVANRSLQFRAAFPLKTFQLWNSSGIFGCLPPFCLPLSFWTLRGVQEDWSSLLLIKVCCDIHVVVVLFWNSDRLGLLELAHYEGWARSAFVGLSNLQSSYIYWNVEGCLHLILSLDDPLHELH